MHVFVKRLRFNTAIGIEIRLASKLATLGYHDPIESYVCMTLLQ